MVIDDEASNLEPLERILKSDGAEVSCFTDPKEAISMFRTGQFDVVLTDLRMGSMDGLEVLSAVKVLDSSVEVILMTAFGTVEIAVEAIKQGAYDFITKPLQKIQVIKCLHKALERRHLLNENHSLKEELNNIAQEAGEVVGRSSSIRSLMDIAGQAARSRANVLIEGESGTGKGILAEYIHKAGTASEGLFVKINCTAIPENLLEAELFGHESGAFTGASRRKKGRVELAHKGTLFLDEIGIAPLSFQAKLLRFLQEGEFERLGSNETQKVETRVISATNADLKQGIKNGVLREDLYYRLNVIHLTVPPLRDRKEDIPLLAKKFIEDSARKNVRDVPLLPSDTIDRLLNYHWPGNVRELQNVMERMVVLSRSGIIQVEDLPAEINESPRRKKMVNIPLGMPLKMVERILMDETLKSTQGNKTMAARLLGVHPRTIYRHLENPSIEEPTPPSSQPVEN